MTTREFDRYDPNTTPRSVKLRFYGPVRVNHATDSPVVLTLWQLVNGYWWDYTIPESFYTVNVLRNADPDFSREIEIHGTGTWQYPAGLYTIKPKLTGTSALRSDLVLDVPPVLDFHYYFDLAPASASAGCLLETNCPCPADFNQDGGVDGADVEAFFIAWEASEPEADANCDGGIDGADVETFFICWELGGC